MDRVKQRSEYTYRCKYCGMECASALLPSGVPMTRTGNYGSNATPTPASHVEEMYETDTISFTAETSSDVAYLSDSKYSFVTNGLQSGMAIRVATTSTTNDGDYTINTRGIQRGKILLSSSDSLTTEDAATAGTVTISRLIYDPNVGTGCGFCGSLNSK